MSSHPLHTPAPGKEESKNLLKHNTALNSGEKREGSDEKQLPERRGLTHSGDRRPSSAERQRPGSAERRGDGSSSGDNGNGGPRIGRSRSRSNSGERRRPNSAGGNSAGGGVKKVGFSHVDIKKFDPENLSRDYTEEHHDIHPENPDSASKSDLHSNFGLNYQTDDNSDELPEINIAMAAKSRTTPGALNQRKPFRNLKRDSIGNLAAHFDDHDQDSEEDEDIINGQKITTKTGMTPSAGMTPGASSSFAGGLDGPSLRATPGMPSAGKDSMNGELINAGLNKSTDTPGNNTNSLLNAANSEIRRRSFVSDGNYSDDAFGDDDDVDNGVGDSKVEEESRIEGSKDGKLDAKRERDTESLFGDEDSRSGPISPQITNPAPNGNGVNSNVTRNATSSNVMNVSNALSLNNISSIHQQSGTADFLGADHSSFQDTNITGLSSLNSGALNSVNAPSLEAIKEAPTPGGRSDGKHTPGALHNNSVNVSQNNLGPLNASQTNLGTLNGSLGPLNASLNSSLNSNHDPAHLEELRKSAAELLRRNQAGRMSLGAIRLSTVDETGRQSVAPRGSLIGMTVTNGFDNILGGRNSLYGLAALQEEDNTGDSPNVMDKAMIDGAGTGAGIPFSGARIPENGVVDANNSMGGLDNALSNGDANLNRSFGGSSKRRRLDSEASPANPSRMTGPAKGGHSEVELDWPLPAGMGNALRSGQEAASASGGQATMSNEADRRKSVIQLDAHDAFDEISSVGDSDEECQTPSFGGRVSGERLSLQGSGTRKDSAKANSAKKSTMESDAMKSDALSQMHFSAAKCDFKADLKSGRRNDAFGLSPSRVGISPNASAVPDRSPLRYVEDSSDDDDAVLDLDAVLGIGSDDIGGLSIKPPPLTLRPPPVGGFGPGASADKRRASLGELIEDEEPGAKNLDRRISIPGMPVYVQGAKGAMNQNPMNQKEGDSHLPHQDNPHFRNMMNSVPPHPRNNLNASFDSLNGSFAHKRVKTVITLDDVEEARRKSVGQAPQEMARSSAPPPAVLQPPSQPEAAVRQPPQQPGEQAQGPLEGGDKQVQGPLGGGDKQVQGTLEGGEKKLRSGSSSNIVSKGPMPFPNGYVPPTAGEVSAQPIRESIFGSSLKSSGASLVLNPAASSSSASSSASGLNSAIMGELAVSKVLAKQTRDQASSPIEALMSNNLPGPIGTISSSTSAPRPNQVSATSSSSQLGQSTAASEIPLNPMVQTKSASEILSIEDPIGRGPPSGADGNSALNSSQNSALGMSFEEFKHLLDLNSVIETTSQRIEECVLSSSEIGDSTTKQRFQETEHRNPGFAMQRQEAGYVPLYPPVSLVDALAAWQRESSTVGSSVDTIIQKLREEIGSGNDSTAFRLSVHNKCVEWLEQAVLEKALDHLNTIVAPVYRKQVEEFAKKKALLKSYGAGLDKSIAEMKREIERIKESIRRENLNRLRQSQASASSQASEQRNQQYTNSLDEQIARVKKAIEEKKRALASAANQDSLDQSAISNASSMHGVDGVLGSEMDQEYTDKRREDLVAYNSNAKREIQGLQTMIMSIQMSNQLSCWRSVSEGRLRFYKRPFHMLRLINEQDGFNEQHGWHFEVGEGSSRCPMRLQQKLAKDMAKEIWNSGTANNIFGSNPDLWRIVFGGKLIELDRFLSELSDVKNFNSEEDEKSFIIRCMVCPSIDCSPRGFRHLYVIPEGTTRACAMFDLTIPRDLLVKNAWNLDKINWCQHVTIGEDCSVGLRGWLTETIAACAKYKVANGKSNLFRSLQNIRQLCHRHIVKKVMSDVERAVFLASGCDSENPDNLPAATASAVSALVPTANGSSTQAGTSVQAGSSVQAAVQKVEKFVTHLAQPIVQPPQHMGGIQQMDGVQPSQQIQSSQRMGGMQLSQQTDGIHQPLQTAEDASTGSQLFIQQTFENGQIRLVPYSTQNQHQYVMGPVKGARQEQRTHPYSNVQNPSHQPSTQRMFLNQDRNDAPVLVDMTNQMSKQGGNPIGKQDHTVNQNGRLYGENANLNPIQMGHSPNQNQIQIGHANRNQLPGSIIPGRLHSSMAIQSSPERSVMEAIIPASAIRRNAKNAMTS